MSKKTETREARAGLRQADRLTEVVVEGDGFYNTFPVALIDQVIRELIRVRAVLI